MAIHIQQLTQAEEMGSVLPLFQQLYPTLTLEKFQEALSIKIPQGYRISALSDNGKLTAACGFWIGHRFYCNKFLQMDNFIVDQKHQSQGYGKHMVDWFKAHAKENQCDHIILDSLVENKRAHQFFAREGFIIRGHHINLAL
jgi:GNAT superfamily N-acetyltransferase